MYVGPDWNMVRNQTYKKFRSFNFKQIDFSQKITNRMVHITYMVHKVTGGHTKMVTQWSITTAFIRQHAPVQPSWLTWCATLAYWIQQLPWIRREGTEGGTCWSWLYDLEERCLGRRGNKQWYHNANFQSHELTTSVFNTWTYLKWSCMITNENQHPWSTIRTDSPSGKFDFVIRTDQYKTIPKIRRSKLTDIDASISVVDIRTR